MYKALTIAGSDSGGGAGIQTDLKTFAALGVYGTSVITALTAQNTQGVHGIHTVPADFVACQLEAVLSDIPISAAKTGMLGDTDIILTVAASLTRFRLHNLVVDPVMVAESGDRLLQQDAVAALRDKLLPLALVVTPNLPEASVLLNREIITVDDMVAAAREIHQFGPRNVLIKGGHLKGPDMVDVFYDGREIYRFQEKKLNTNHTHGTGCTYAAAITANLARGLEPLTAVRQAKQFITQAIAHGICIGSGYGPTNPMGALWYEVEAIRAKEALKDALGSLQKEPHTTRLFIEGESTIFYCIDGAEDVKNVAALPVPLTSCFRLNEWVGEPVWGGAVYPAEMLVVVHKQYPSIRAMVNLRCDSLILDAAQSLEYKISTAEHKSDTKPDLFILQQSDGPAQILVLAATAKEAVQKSAALSRRFNSC